MREPEQLLDQVFSLARRARDPIPSELPFGMDTAVLAEWRSFLASSTSDIGMLRVFRWAAIMACVIAVAGATLKREDIEIISQHLDPETRIVNSALLAGLDR
jgi:hypothetical protein